MLLDLLEYGFVFKKKYHINSNPGEMRRIRFSELFPGESFEEAVDEIVRVCNKYPLSMQRDMEEIHLDCLLSGPIINN